MNPNQKRARGSFHKAQYLRIQGWTLIFHSSDMPTQEVGARLLQRVIAEYPSEVSQVMSAHESLGDYYASNDVELAEYHYRAVLAYYAKTNSRSNTTGLVDLKLVKLFIETNNKFDESRRIFEDFPLSELTFNSMKYYYCVLGAQLYHELGQPERAKIFAKEALALSAITKPQFSRHKDVGLVNATSAEIRQLTKIANGL